MRVIGISLIALFISSTAFSNEINISTVTKDEATTFYLQAGAYSLEKDAQKRLTELKPHLKNVPVEVKKLSDKGLFLVQIGPINDYPAARSLKDELSLKTLSLEEQVQEPQSSLLTVAPVAKKDQPPALKEANLWNLRNADIRAVIAEVSRVTKKNFVIDPRVQGKVSIVSSKPMSEKELYQVFLSVLQVSGYAAIPTGDIVKIVPNVDAKTLSPDAINLMGHPPQGEDMMVAVIPVNYVPAEQLVPVLRPLMPQWSSISAYAPSNMVILSGRANNIDTLADIIKQVDSSSANGIDIVRLQHALAMDVATTLKELIKTQSGQASRMQIMVTADDRSNSILISASKTDRIRLRMLIMKLDKQSSEGINNNTKVIYLNYMRAEDLVPILAGIAQANFSGNVGTTIGTVTRQPLDSTNPASSLADSSSSGQGGFGASSSPSYSTSAGANSAATANTSSTMTKNEGSTKPTIQIIGEPNTNSIIVNAPASIIRILKSVIAQLDIKPAQLLIEALVAEVNETDANNLGIEWGTDGQTGNPEKFRAGFAIVNSKSSVDDLQAQIYALAREQKANILSTPSVVVLDNRQAKILVGKQVSVASTSYPNNANGTAPSSSPYTTFNRVNVALHLYVRPQITRGQGIQMQIDQGNDTLDPTDINNTNANPTFKISSIVTSVHVNSGSTVILGGLTQDSLGNDDNRLPILGDIPGLGRLFQHNIKTRDKRVLMVFIKPKILKNPKDDMYVTSEKYNDVRQYQLDWLRSEEVFEQNAQETILPPLSTPTLPKPFEQQHVQAMVDEK